MSDKNEVVITPEGPKPTLPQAPVEPAPAPEPNPNNAPVPSALLKHTIGLIMKIARGVSKMTSYEFDDKAVEILEPIVNTDEFAEFVASLVNEFRDEKITLAQIKAKFTK